MINIATDGACKGNPGPGGWGVAIFENDEYIQGLCGGELGTTNNRMELQAFIVACTFLDEMEDHDDDVTIHIDSTYVLKGSTEWLRGWRQKDYKGVKNDDLWRQVADLRHIWLNCELKWCKGHSGNLYNEKADDLANEGCKEVMNDDGW